VTGSKSVSRENVYESLGAYSADRIILDTYNANQAGGTGKTFDWGLAQQLGKHVRLPIILAGGLNPGNVRQAIEQVSPFAVDTSSGVEGVGIKDEEKVRSFIEAVRGESR
jgi:phosphoribosylanthranilate isomerase